MKLTLAYDAVKSEFTLTIANISSGTANETPFSAGVWGGYYEKSDIIVFGAVYDGYDWL